MFSGIVQELAEVIELSRESAPIRLRVRCERSAIGVAPGESIAINGVCLSAISVKDHVLEFELASETLRATQLGELKTGSTVNLERALKLGDVLSGHFVSGHVDACVTLLARSEEQGTIKLVFALPPKLARYVAPKGSLTLNGVSLTVGEVETDRFSVYIIPITARETNLGALQLGAHVNLEVDLLARYVVNALGAYS